MRQKQINVAKKSGSKHIFQKEFKQKKGERMRKRIGKERQRNSKKEESKWKSQSKQLWIAIIFTLYILILKPQK